MLHRGKLATTPKVLSSRPLVREDLACLREKRHVGSVKRFRDSHVRLARLLVSGLRRPQVIQMSGYSPTRIAALEALPSFQDLMAKERSVLDREWANQIDPIREGMWTLLSQNIRMTLDSYEEAEETGETIPLKILQTDRADFLDRLGFGKTQTNVNVHLDYAKNLEGARKRSQQVRIIEASPSSPSPQSSAGLRAPDAPQRPSHRAGQPLDLDGFIRRA